MKEADKEKDAHQKAQATVSIEKWLLEALEERARKAGTTPSNVVALLLQRYILTDETWYTEMARFHAGKLQEYIFVRDQLRTQKEILETGR
jgi:hypothetical protein